MRILYTERQALAQIALKVDELERRLGQMYEANVSSTEVNSAFRAFEVGLDVLDTTLNSVILSAVAAVDRKREAVCV